MRQLKRVTLKMPGRRTPAATAPNNRYGGMAAEAAIVFPIFLLFVLGMFELGRYFMVDTALGHAAQKGLALAKVIPQLEDDSPDDSGNPKNAPLISQIEDLARATVREVYGDAGNLQVSLVLPSGVPTLRDALNKEPMDLLISADFQPLFGTVKPIRLTHKAVGFREPLFASSMPELVNCFGEKVSQNQTRIDPQRCKCEDPLALLPDCRCPDWSQWIGNSQERLATAPLAKGPNGKCGCSHVAGAVVNQNGQYCECPPCSHEGEFRLILNGSCQCVDCEAQGLLEDESGACACPKCSSDPNSAAVYSNLGSGCGCTCPFWEVSYALTLGNYIRYENGGCVCAANQSTCDELKPGSLFFFRANHYGKMICDCRPCSGQAVMNMTTHKCECPLTAEGCESGNDDQMLSVGECRCITCTNGKKRINGACRCPPDRAQTCVSQGSIVSEYDCRCQECSEPSVPSADGTKCECPDEASCEPPFVLDRTYCYCKCPDQTADCPPGRYYDDTDCSCRCDMGVETNFNGDCKGCADCPGRICGPQECETRSCSMGPDCRLVVNET